MRVINYIKRKMDERHRERENRNSNEKAAHATAVATRWMAAFTLALAACAIYQFLILSRQLEVMRIDERAWIYPRPGQNYKQEIGVPIGTDVEFGNSGKTPARHVDVVEKIEILNADESPAFDYSNKLLNQWVHGNFIMPNQPPFPAALVAKRQVPGTETTEMVTYTQSLIDEYNAGRVWISIEGVVSYEDVFNVWHHVTFCYAGYNRVAPMPNPPGAKVCVDYNSSD